MSKIKTKWKFSPWYRAACNATARGLARGHCSARDRLQYARSEYARWYAAFKLGRALAPDEDTRVHSIVAVGQAPRWWVTIARYNPDNPRSPFECVDRFDLPAWFGDDCDKHASVRADYSAGELPDTQLSLAAE